MPDSSDRPRALVIDDDQPIRFMISRVLELEGFLVDAARDGFEAIELLKKNDYALVFLDLMLPNIDGFGVLGFLRSSAPDLLSSVIVMTAGSPEGIREPVRAVMTKPFELEQLRIFARTAAAEPEARSQKS